CDILFISESEDERVDEILAALKNRPILTVSDAANFAQRGGIIRFVTAKSRVRLEINPDAAQGAHLTLSSKLLRLADLVTPPGR
ncbi:MAG TPA: YfiR family protein, partial [Gemmatimonadales bacterium]|nr:YfiR family protein [Gemmatimonadales bacterium]